jgi:cytidylate kinase
VARALGLRYLDTGAMYRALTWWMLSQNLDTTDPAAVARNARVPVIEVGTDPAAPVVIAGGMDVSAQIRGRAVSNAVSAVASVPAVREHLIAMQQAIIAQQTQAGGGIVAEGRDIGTVVSPEAPLKVFLTASDEERARRRAAESGEPVEDVLAAQRRRDARDTEREHGALRAAEDAVELDTTGFSRDEVVARVIALVRERGLA